MASDPGKLLSELDPCGTQSLPSSFPRGVSFLLLLQNTRGNAMQRKRNVFQANIQANSFGDLSWGSAGFVVLSMKSRTVEKHLAGENTHSCWPRNKEEQEWVGSHYLLQMCPSSDRTFLTQPPFLKVPPSPSISPG